MDFDIYRIQYAVDLKEKHYWAQFLFRSHPTYKNRRPPPCHELDGLDAPEGSEVKKLFTTQGYPVNRLRLGIVGMPRLEAEFRDAESGEECQILFGAGLQG